MAEANPTTSDSLPPRPSNLMRRVTKAMPLVGIWKETKYRLVMQGLLSDLPPVDTKVIRIFISSTFSGENLKDASSVGVYFLYYIFLHCIYNILRKI